MILLPYAMCKHERYIFITTQNAVDALGMFVGLRPEQPKELGIEDVVGLLHANQSRDGVPREQTSRPSRSRRQKRSRPNT